MVNLVRLPWYALISTHSQRSTVYETYSGTFTQQYLLDEQGQWNGNLSFKFHETVAGDNIGEKMAEVFVNFIQIEML